MRHSERKNALSLSSEVLAGSESGEKGHHERLSRYAKAKTHQLNVLDYILTSEPDLAREARQMEGCSHTLIFRHWYTVNKYRLIGGCTCKKHLLCAMCALRRSAKTVKEVEKKIKTVLSENPHLVPVLITMTIRNGESLNERYKHITKSKKTLLHSRRNALHGERRKTKSVTSLIHGSVGSYEFKQGQGGHGWHPHSHEIALLDPAVEFQNIVLKGKEVSCPVMFQQALSQEWLKITSDSFVVDVRRIEACEGKTYDESLLKAICEASKYALKLNDMEIPDQIHAYKVLRCRRLTFSYGSLWGIKVPDDMNDDIESELELLPYVDLVYQFYSGQYSQTDVTDLGDLKKVLKVEKRSSRLSSTIAVIADKAYSVDQVTEWVKKENPTCASARRFTDEELLYRKACREKETLDEIISLNRFHGHTLNVIDPDLNF